MTAEVVASRLDALRQAVLDGRFAELDPISAMLETDMQGLRGRTAEELAVIAVAARRTARCLEAAAGGARAAQRRIAELAAAERPQTYGNDGRKRNMAGRDAGTAAGMHRI